MYDVVIVGSGLGGLTLGALLAKRGRKVSVIEQHYVAGGCATIFRRKGYRFEVGLHAMDGMDEVDPKMYIFRDLDMLQNVPFVHIPRSEFFRFKHPELDITVPATVDGAVEVLGKQFPAERRRLREFFATLYELRAGLCDYFMQDRFGRFATALKIPFTNPNIIRYRNTTIGDFLDAMFDDELLKLTLLSNLLYYHDNPRKLSLLWFSLSQGSFFAGGVHFVKGGSQVLSDYLVNIIKQHGGEVLLGQTVEEVIVEQGRAVGANFRKTLGRNRPEGSRRGKMVVVNAPMPMAVNELIKDPRIEPFRRKVNRLQKSCSFLSLYLGLKTGPNKLGNAAYSTILPGDNLNTINDFQSEFHAEDWTTKGFEFVDYSHIDHGLAKNGKSVAVISLVDYIHNWDNLSEEDYKTQKDEVAEALIARTERDLIPGIRDHIELYEVGTPKTIVRYTRNPEGSIYGFHQNPSQSTMFRPGHRSSIGNLYFASAWSMPGGGFTGAMLSGLNCAREVDRALGGSAENWLTHPSMRRSVIATA